MERRQVFDLPPMTVRVTEHQLIARRCGCGATTCGTAPDGVTAPVQYGPRITAIVLYLYAGQFLSKQRTAAGAGRAVRHPGLGGHRRGDDRTRRRRARRVPRRRGATLSPRPRSPGSTRPGCGSRAPALGALRPHRQVHPDHLPPQARPQGHRRRRSPAPVQRCRGARRLGTLRHLRRPRPPALLRARAARAARRRRHRGPRTAWCWADQVADALVAMQRLVAERAVRAPSHRSRRAGRTGSALPLRGPDRRSPKPPPASTAS